MRDDHCRRCEQQSEAAQRASTREEQVDNQACDHRRQTHEGVYGDNSRMTAGEAQHSERGAKRQPQNRREKDRGKTHTQRKRDNSDERGIARQNKPPRCGKGVGNIVQGGASSA